MNEMSDVRRELAEIQRALGRIEGNQLSQQSTIAAHIISNDNRLNDAEEAISVIQQKQAYSSGKSSVYGVISGAVMGILSGAVSHFLGRA